MHFTFLRSLSARARKNCTEVGKYYTFYKGCQVTATKALQGYSTALVSLLHDHTTFVSSFLSVLLHFNHPI